mmetsp:Transcript_11789/g.32669  ORF Transcript_11789/g.32669 Transcript_11789/m.32669 type:complete len:711 (+) Transcript_11789:258-2390(+)
MIVNPFSSSTGVGSGGVWSASHPFVATRRGVRQDSKRDSNNSNSNNNTEEDTDEDTAKYDKSKRQQLRRKRRLQRKSSANPDFKTTRILLTWFTLVCCLSISIFYLGYQLFAWSTGHYQDSQHAWNRFEAAKRKVRQQHHNKNGMPQLPNMKNRVGNHRPQRQHDDTASAAVANDHMSSSQKEDLKAMTLPELMELFDMLRPKDPRNQKFTRADKEVLYPILKEWAKRLDNSMKLNRAGGMRWIRHYLLPPMEKGQERELVATPDHAHEQEPPGFFKVKRISKGLFRGSNNQGGQDEVWEWEKEWKNVQREHQHKNTDGDNSEEPAAKIEIPPPVDYTDPNKYEYPPIMPEPPKRGGYPEVKTLGQLLQNWPQNQDNLADKIHEALMHFNYSDPEERAMAVRFREARLPFKVYDIPDIDAVTQKWTDDYVHRQFDTTDNLEGLQADGLCQESPDHFFAFFVPQLWQTGTFGLPPVRNNDWTYHSWSEHAKYADATSLESDRPHYYWQAGVTKSERFADPEKQSFISRDLKNTLGAEEDNFFVFNIDEQKGIQCRFGERGVTAATHFDAGQNMIAMLTGAKRYILSPPHACPKLGVFNTRESPIFRHSLLNFAHLEYLNGNSTVHDIYGEEMSQRERDWLAEAAEAPALETVLKAGEVMFLPSFWFHYIVSVQKSAQCNVRSGVDRIGTKEFGGAQDINRCGDHAHVHSKF